jgi:hypothetical protein
MPAVFLSRKRRLRFSKNVCSAATTAAQDPPVAMPPADGLPRTDRGRRKGPATIDHTFLKRVNYCSPRRKPKRPPARHRTPTRSGPSLDSVKNDRLPAGAFRHQMPTLDSSTGERVPETTTIPLSLTW